MIESSDIEAIRNLREACFEAFRDIYQMGCAAGIREFNEKEMEKIFIKYYEKLKSEFYIELYKYKNTPCQIGPTIQ